MADGITLLSHAARLSAETHTLQLGDLLTWKGMACWSAHYTDRQGGYTWLFWPQLQPTKRVSQSIITNAGHVNDKSQQKRPHCNSGQSSK